MPAGSIGRKKRAHDALGYHQVVARLFTHGVLGCARQGNPGERVAGCTGVWFGMGDFYIKDIVITQPLVDIIVHGLNRVFFDRYTQGIFQTLPKD